MAHDDESRTGDEDAAAADTAIADAEDYKLSLDVKIEDVGPCKKHVRMTVPRDDIDHFYSVAINELSGATEVPGFRKGHVPKKLVERRFKSEIASDVKQKILVGSLEQLSDESDLDPINEPNIDFENIEIPEEGDFEFEFDVEVRPDFDVPDYDGLKVERPVQAIGDEDVDAYLNKYLAQYGQLVPHDGAAEAGDFVNLSVEFFHNDQPLRKISELVVQVKPVLRFQDAELENFGELMSGAKSGDVQEADVTISGETESLEMRGETVQAKFTVLDVKQLRLPELNKEFLNRIKVDSEEELRESVHSILERQTTYEQRQAVRKQVLEKITESADWDLPEDLVLRQVDNALRREMLEMQQAGFTTQDIQARENEMRQRAVSTTRQALKEHFVLDKIATREGIEVEPQDIESEIGMMALQSGESPRRVRARLVKSGMIENLEAQVRERKAVDFVLERAKYEDVDMKQPDEDRIEAVAESVCDRTTESSAAADQDDDAGAEDDS